MLSARLSDLSLIVACKCTGKQNKAAAKTVAVAEIHSVDKDGYVTYRIWRGSNRNRKRILADKPLHRSDFAPGLQKEIDQCIKTDLPVAIEYEPGGAIDVPVTDSMITGGFDVVVCYSSKEVRKEEKMGAEATVFQHCLSFEDVILSAKVDPTRIRYAVGFIVAHVDKHCKLVSLESDQLVSLEEFIQMLPARENVLYGCGFNERRDGARIQQLATKYQRTLVWIESKETQIEHRIGLVTPWAFTQVVGVYCYALKNKINPVHTLFKETLQLFRKDFNLWVIEPQKMQPWSPFTFDKFEPVREPLKDQTNVKAVTTTATTTTSKPTHLPDSKTAVILSDLLQHTQPTTKSSSFKPLANLRPNMDPNHWANLPPPPLSQV